MPSGARTIEQGRPSTCGNSQSPTASKYRTRSNFVTGRSSPASGQNTLFGLETVTPITLFSVAPARPTFGALGVTARLACDSPFDAPPPGAAPGICDSLFDASPPEA